MSLHTTISRATESIATKITNAAGNTYLLLLVLFAAIAWGISGFYLHFSQAWEMIISTASSVVTFIMVFLIQKSQNKHSLSIQLKLNELVAANHLASNRLVDVEGMSEDELKVIKKYYEKLSCITGQEKNPRSPHSIDETHYAHSIKKELDDELGNIKSH